MANFLELIPGYQAAKGLTTTIKSSILQKEVDRQNKEIEKRRTKLLSLAKSTSNNALRDVYLKQASNLTNFALEDLSSVLSEAPTSKQVLSSSAELALTLTGGSAIKALSGGYKALKTGQIATKTQMATQVFNDLTKTYKAKQALSTASKAAKTLNVAKSIIGSGVEGAAYGALSEQAINKNATLESTAKSAAITGAFGAGLNIAGRGIGAGLELSEKKINPATRKAYNFFKTKLDDYASGKVKSNTAYDEILNTVEKEKSISQKVAQKTVDILEGGERNIAKFLDRYSPIKKMEELTWKAKGLPLEDKEQIYTQVRLLNGKVDSLTEKEIGSFTQKINTIIKNDKILKQDSIVYLKALDDLDRANKGQLLEVVNGKSQKVTIEKAEQRLMEIQAKFVNEGKLESLESIRKIWNDYTGDELVKMKNAGLISDAEIVAMKEAHPNYIPHKVLFDTQEKSYLKASLNVNETGFKKALGSIRDIKDPYDALGARTQLLNRKIKQNELLKNIVDSAKTYEIDGFRPIQTAENVKNKKQLLSQLKDKTELKKQLSLLKFDKKLDSKLSSEITSLKKEAVSEYNKIARNIDVNAEEIPEELIKDFNKFNSTIDKIENKLEGSNLSKDLISDLKDNISNIKLNRKNTWLDALKLSRKKVGSNEETLSFFKDGIKETWVVPEDIAVAIKGTDVIPPSGVLKFVSNANRIFKNLTTTFNPEFAIPNKFRDEQTALVTANTFIQEMANRTGVSPRDVNLTTKELKALWKESGGIGSNVYKDGEEAIFKGLEDKGIMKFVKDPTKVLSSFSDYFEQATRLKVFQNGLKAGLSADNAALVARDATIDFAKMGTTMQTLNQVIPFLNARVQGFTNLGRAIKDNPEMFMRTQMLTSVYPVMALDKWNSQWDSYKNISQDIKDKYWIVMANEVESTNEDGDVITVPQFITIPKGEGQTLVANPVQYFLERARVKDPRSVTKMLVDTLGSASPLEFQRFSTDNPLLTFTSQFGAIGGITGGLISGKDPYFGTDLVPMDKEGAYGYLKYKPSTPEYLKKLANILANPDENGKPQGINVSPSYLNFIINSTGGIPQALNKTADLIYGKLSGKKSSSQKSETTFGELTQTPVVRRFTRESSPYYSPENKEEGRIAKEVETEVKSKKIVEKEKLNNAVEDFIQAYKSDDYDNEKLSDYWNNYIIGNYQLSEEQQQSVLKDINDIVAGIKSGSVGSINVNQSVEVRARLIYEKFNKILKESGQEEANKFQQELIDKKILTESVLEFMNSDDFTK